MIKEIEVDGVRHSIQAENTIKTTWAELKALRDEAKLNAGTFYRITDYVTTTTQSETKSANHPFDVIVLALSENTLCEDAKAILHEGDTYFADSDLSAWELKYCLDNDKTRFEWADETNGKGVIYRMIDEKANDCPYDFKNILFYNTKVTNGTTSDYYYYTFSYVDSGVRYDGTTEKRVMNCYGNVMGEYRNSGVLKLNANVFTNVSLYYGCHSNTFGHNCHSNVFGNSCHSNIFGNDCSANVLGNVFNSNTFGNACHSNIFEYDCAHNTFGNAFQSNKFREYVKYNIFGNYCKYNTFGNGCFSNIFGNGCAYDTFGKLEHRYVDPDKTSITLNEEFYDDGSGQLVPIKHPDLSTQPSILPYKFMGQYVYEILLPIHDIDLSKSSYIVNASKLLEYVKDLSAVAILQAEELLFCYRKGQSSYPSVPMFVHRNISINTDEQYGGTAYYSLAITPDKTYTATNYTGDVVKAYLRIVYTSMPEEGDYYGYNEY